MKDAEPPTDGLRIENRQKLSQPLSPRAPSTTLTLVFGAGATSGSHNRFPREDPRRAAQRTDKIERAFDPDAVRQLSTAIWLHLEKVNRDGEHRFLRARRYV
jgi:hypothetical protein